MIEIEGIQEIRSLEEEKDGETLYKASIKYKEKHLSDLIALKKSIKDGELPVIQGRDKGATVIPEERFLLSDLLNRTEDIRACLMTLCDGKDEHESQLMKRLELAQKQISNLHHELMLAIRADMTEQEEIGVWTKYMSSFVMRQILGLEPIEEKGETE